jgi:hypothetical protein
VMAWAGRHAAAMLALHATSMMTAVERATAPVASATERQVSIQPCQNMQAEMLNFTDSKLWTALILLLCGTGAWLSAQLLKRHDNIWQSSQDDDTSLFAKLCRAASLGKTTGCDNVSHSAWSQLPIPYLRPHRNFTFSWRVKRVPIAFAGLAWFTGIAIRDGSWRDPGTAQLSRISAFDLHLGEPCRVSRHS